MSEKKKKICPIPEILTFKGIRKVALERVWERVEKAEKAGKVLLTEDFGSMLKEEWVKLKKQAVKAKKVHDACLVEARTVMQSKTKSDIEQKLDSLISSDKGELKKLGIEASTKKVPKTTTAK
ncbi:unnamed protein product [marine sediment metagenome]|uniref:Uncharacterized protein n=1 Tax=marine sediment metagenome TaxID=412755 RepID=X1S0L7_9ZZZZ